MMEEVDQPARMGTRTTSPPQERTSRAPTMSSSAYSDPLTSTSGRTWRMTSSGVGAANMVTADTGSQGGDQRGPVFLGDEGPVGSLELADRGVAVDGHQEPVGMAGGLGQAPEVAGVDQVEAAVGEGDGAPPAARSLLAPGRQFVGPRAPVPRSTSRACSVLLEVPPRRPAARGSPPRCPPRARRVRRHGWRGRRRRGSRRRCRGPPCRRR